MASRGHRSDEDPGVYAHIRHPDSISQDRAARVRRRRINRDDSDRLAVRSERPDEPVDQRALPHPRRAGEADYLSAARVRIDPREGLDRLRFVVLNQRDELPRRPFVSFEEGINEASDGVARGLLRHGAHAPLPAFSKNETMSLNEVPGPKTALTPARFSFGTSSSGIMPPPTTTMSPDFLFIKRRTTSGNNVMCAPLREERPIASTSSWIAASTMSSAVCLRPASMTSMPASR